MYSYASANYLDFCLRQRQRYAIHLEDAAPLRQTHCDTPACTSAVQWTDKSETGGRMMMLRVAALAIVAAAVAVAQSSLNHTLG